MRKIAYYTIHEKPFIKSGSKLTGKERFPAKEIKEILTYLSTLPEADRKYYITQKKFCKLEELEEIGNEIQFGFIKSATQGFRPNLWDGKTDEERANPKNLTEGEIIKTHFAIKYTENEVFLILEQNRSGLSINAFLEYIWFKSLSYFETVDKEREYHLDYDMLIKENFEQELKKLNRVVSADVYVDKKILGDGALGYSNRIESIKESITLTIKAERKMDISSSVLDAFYKFSAGGSEIIKIRATGRNKSKENVIIDTSFIQKLDYIDAERNVDTGEVVTPNMKTQMLSILNNI